MRRTPPQPTAAPSSSSTRTKAPAGGSNTEESGNTVVYVCPGKVETRIAKYSARRSWASGESTSTCVIVGMGSSVAAPPPAATEGRPRLRWTHDDARGHCRRHRQAGRHHPRRDRGGGGLLRRRGTVVSFRAVRA